MFGIGYVCWEIGVYVSALTDFMVTLSPEKEPQYSLGRRVGVPQSWSGHGGKEKVFPSLPLLGIKQLSSLSRSHYNDWVTMTPYYSGWILSSV
jgi:hypothetical protein